MSRLVLILSCSAFLSLWSGAVAAKNVSLNQIQQIAESGTPGLALKLLDELHPGTEKGFGEWFRWSRVRSGILAKWKQWPRAIGHLQQLPETLPEPLQRWALSQRAWLQLEQGNSQSARQLLRQLVWRSGEREQDPAEGALWRRLIIRSYLIEDRIGDAATAMHRYQQDYAGSEPAWLQLRARILLRQQKPAAILEWSPEALLKLTPPLLMLSRLRSAQRDPAVVRDQAVVRAEDESISKADRARYWKIAGEASYLLNDPVNVVIAIEQALDFASELPVSDKVFRTSISDLWESYRRYGVDAGNQMYLLIGDDIAWFNAVENVRIDNPLLAKGLLTVLSQQATSDSRREQALVQLAALLEAERGDLQLVVQMFFDAKQFPTLDEVPVKVRYQLVEYALSVSDIVMASDLLATLSQQPADIDEFSWGLRRARVMIMGGRTAEGSEVLDSLLDDQLFISPEQLDKLMQVLFDLQSADYHEQALNFFVRLENERQIAAKQRRELFFWMAESLSATERYTQAALYYMRSATYTDPKGADLWGQSARYNAAEALAQAGLTSDARRLYQSLLQSTADPARRAVLRNRLQKLWVAPVDAGDVAD